MGDKRKVVPRHEPEVIEAIARGHYHGDDEKVPTTAITHLTVDGIRITSRYDKADELSDMQAMIEVMPPSVRAKISSISCDSKCTLNYNVALRHWDQEEARVIGNELQKAAFVVNRGHNGITVEPDDVRIRRQQEIVNINPDWMFDEEG